MRLRTRPEIVSDICDAIDRTKATANPVSFTERLKREQIDAIFRRTKEGRIYGVTFVDYRSRTVINGSHLGKEYAARIWDDWFKQTPRPEPVPLAETGTTLRPAAEVNHFPEQPRLPSLIDKGLSDGLDAFGFLFEPEYTPYEYIDPAFRLIRKKKKYT